MPDKFGWDNNFGSNPAPTRHKHISFGRSQPWSDRMGKHTVIEIRRGAAVIGKIHGESGVGIPMMQYTVECEGVRPFTAQSLDDAKAGVRSHLGVS